MFSIKPVVANVSDINDVCFAEPYDNSEEVVDAGTASPVHIVSLELDRTTREQKLSYIYDEIREKGFSSLLYADDTYNLLKQYPEFDVTVSCLINPTNKTMLDCAIIGSSPKLAKTIINFPTMTIQSLEHSLEYLNTFSRPNKSQMSVKKMIQQKLEEKYKSIPSAPPLEEVEPSAPPFEPFNI